MSDEDPSTRSAVICTSDDMTSSSARCTGAMRLPEKPPGCGTCTAGPRQLSDAGSRGAFGRQEGTERVGLSARAGHLAISPAARRRRLSSLQRIQSVDACKRITCDRIGLLSVTVGPTCNSRTPPMPAAPPQQQKRLRTKMNPNVDQRSNPLWSSQFHQRPQQTTGSPLAAPQTYLAMLRQERLSVPRTARFLRILASRLANYCDPRLATFDS
jgi:hypothetical protein